MTSKELITVSASPYNSETIHLPKRDYSLRPRRNTSTIYERKEKKFLNLKSVVNIKRLATSVRSQREKLPIKDAIQEPSDSFMDVSQFIEDVDLSSFSDMVSGSKNTLDSHQNYQTITKPKCNRIFDIRQWSLKTFFLKFYSSETKISHFRKTTLSNWPNIWNRTIQLQWTA